MRMQDAKMQKQTFQKGLHNNSINIIYHVPHLYFFNGVPWYNENDATNVTSAQIALNISGQWKFKNVGFQIRQAVIYK